MYSLKETLSEENVSTEDLEILKSIKAIVETIDFEKLTPDKAIRILKLIKKILV